MPLVTYGLGGGHTHVVYVFDIATGYQWYTYLYQLWIRVLVKIPGSAITN